MAKAAQFADDNFGDQKLDMAPSRAHFNVSEELRLSSLSLSKRNMVMDEDRFEEQFLKCSICKTRFTQTSLPRLLPCHHSFCHACVLHVYRKAKEQRQALQASLRTMTAPLTTVNVTCPTCRSNFPATEDSVHKLPTDHRVVQLMDFINHTERSTISYCSKHDRLPLNFFCEPCVRPICRDCTLKDHREDRGHLVMDLEKALAQYMPALDTAITEMDAEANSIEEKKTALASVAQSVDDVKFDLLSDARAVMNRLRKVIDEREKALEAKIHLEIENEKRKLGDKKEQLSQRKKMLETQTKRLRQAKEEGNVEDIFHIHEDIREYMADPPIKIREVDDGIMTSFTLIARDESLLTSRINNFGEVCTKMETTASKTKTPLRSYSRHSSTS